MKKIAIAAAALFAATAALAEGPIGDNAREVAAASGKTRAQVQAELQQAIADGSIKAWSTSYNPLVVAKSTKTREQVRAELFASKGIDDPSLMTGEDSGAFALARRAAPAVGPILAGQPRNPQ